MPRELSRRALFIVLVLSCTFASCTVDDPRFGPVGPSPVPPTTQRDVPMVSGLGGAFIYSADPTRLAKWYQTNLGIELEKNEEDGGYYHQFICRDLYEPNRKLRTVWAVLPAPDEERANASGFLVNYRVNGLDRVLEHLKANGVEVQAQEQYEYGRFAWVEDADGNRVELYEPNEP